MAGKPGKKSRDLDHDPGSLARLPEENPNPVLRIGNDGALLYANAVARALIDPADGQNAYPRLVERIASATRENRTIDADFDFGGDIFAMSFIPVAERKYVNVFGRNVTSEREAQRHVRDLAKFPSENPNPVMRSDREGRVIYMNATAQSLPELTVPGDPPRFSDALVAKVRDAVRAGESRYVEIDSGGRAYSFQVNPVAGEIYVNIYGREITAERQATAALVAAKDTLEERVRERTASVRLLENIVLAANSAESLESALQTALHEICLYTGWPVGHAYIVVDDGEASELAPKGIWHVDRGDNFAALRAATESMRFGGGDDLPGRVMRQRHAIWIEHLDREPDFPRAAFTSKAGIKSGIAFPVLLNGQVAAVLEFFSAETTRLDEGILATLSNVGIQLGSVAERKRADEALRRSQRDASQAHGRLLDAIEAVSEGFALFDGDERLVLCNTKFKELVFGNDQHLIAEGISFEEMIRAAIYAGLIPDAAGNEEAWLARRMERHRAMERMLINNRDGRWIQVDEHRTSEGGFVALYSDVTELKERERELRELVEEVGVARDEAIRANATKSQFLANMSHELRTPLNAIIGYSELLLDEAEDDGLDSYQADLRKIQSAGRHLLGLINDILDLSKIEAGKIELFLEDVDLNELIGGVVDTISPLVSKNGNRLTVDCPDGLGRVHSDVTRLRQILINILSNAAKFTENGEISFSVGRQPGDQDAITFTIADQGIGMSAEQVERVFEPFVQADASITQKFGGTGLGMAITREFCRMLGGDIVCDSVLGRGSTFSVRLPADSRPAETNAAAQTEALGGEVQLPDDAPLVLVIDDDPNVRDLLRRNLGSAGIRTVGAADGTEGLRQVKEHRPDAITLDVIMPGTDGWTVLSELKADPETADIPVIMITIVEDRQLGFSLGASEYLAKPIDRTRLHTVLERYLGDTNGRTVLIVEDDAKARQMICRLMKRDGVRSIEAENGRVGLEKLASERPDLILLDLMMPEIDGFEFVERVRANAEWADIPIVVITAKTLTEEDRARLNGSISDLYRKADQKIEEVVRSLTKRLRHTSRTADSTVPRPTDQD